MSQERKPRIQQRLDDIDQFVDWQALLDLVKVIDQTQSGRGGRPRMPALRMLKILFLQQLYNLSDPETEDQLLDRRSFRGFVGIDDDHEVPVFSTIWRFKQALITHHLLDRIFDQILDGLDQDGLILRQGTIIDAQIIVSSNRPLSKNRREELEQKQADGESVSQIDLDAHSTKKRGKYYFGYKGHIGVDVGSKLIRKQAFTPANVHDSQEKLFLGDERAHFGDKAYANEEDKRAARANGIYYGVLDKGKRNHPLSKKQKKRNRKHSSVRAQVEHPFAYFRCKLGCREARCKTRLRNQLVFTFNCLLYNIERGLYLLKRRQAWS